MTKGTDATELTPPKRTDDGTTSCEQHLSKATELREWLDTTGAEHRRKETNTTTRDGRTTYREPMACDLGQRMYDWAATVRYLIEREKSRS